MRKNSVGFSLTEVTIVLLVGMVLSAIFLMGFQQANTVFSATAGEETITAKLRQAREIAIAQRKCIVVSFAEPNLMTISVQTSLTGDPALLETAYLPAGIVYNDGIGGYTPEGMAGLVNMRGRSFVYLGDGTARSDVNARTPMNGVIYLGPVDTTNRTAASAITVLGSTGRARSYHYDASQGGWY